MQSKVFKSKETKVQRTSIKVLQTPSFAKATQEDSPKNSSNFKEIQRLRGENLKLAGDFAKCQEELARKDEFCVVLSSFPEEKYDMRRMHMYRAKVAKQERLVSGYLDFFNANRFEFPKSFVF